MAAKQMQWLQKQQLLVIISTVLEIDWAQLGGLASFMYFQSGGGRAVRQ